MMKQSVAGGTLLGLWNRIYVIGAALTMYGLVACTSDATTQPSASLSVATPVTAGSLAPLGAKPLNSTCDYYPELNLTVCCPPTLVRAGADSGATIPFDFLASAAGCTYSPGPQNPSAPPVGYEPYVPLPPEAPETPPDSPGTYNPPPQDYGGGGNNPEGNGPGSGGGAPDWGGGDGGDCTQVRAPLIPSILLANNGSVCDSGPASPRPPQNVADVARWLLEYGFDPDLVERITPEEKAECYSNKRVCLVVVGSREDAQRLSRQHATYDPLALIQDGQADGYRHVIWQARLTVALGEVLAKKWGDLHETSNAATSTSRSSAMDYSNNALGRILGLELLAAQRTSEFDLIQRVVGADRACRIIYYSRGECPTRQP
jgi:hypothetical protein